MEYLEALKEAVEIAKFPSPQLAKRVSQLIETLDTDLSSGGYRSSEDFDDAYDAVVDEINALDDDSKEKVSVIIDGDAPDLEDVDEEDEITIDEDDEEEEFVDDEDDDE
jgi:hypothetical protein